MMTRNFLEEYELYNPIQAGQNKSQIEHLLDSHAILEDVVFGAVDFLERSDAPYVAAFFQIPDAIFVGDRPFRVRALEDNVSIDLQFTPFRLDPGTNGLGKISRDDQSPSFYGNATQVVAYVPVFGRRKKHFSNYEKCFTTSGMTNGVVANPAENWRGPGR